MRFEITDPCEEPWESMEPREGGRYCGHCEKVVIDLATMTRKDAERRIAAIDADRVCVQLAVDRLGEAVFVRPPPSRAPHWARGLVLVSALGASAGCAPAEAPCAAKIVEVAADPGPPMMPTVLATIAPAPATGPVPAAELRDPAQDDAVPTAEQRALTAAKHRPPPIHHMMRGGMALHQPLGNAIF